MEGWLETDDGRIWYRRVGVGGMPLLTLHGGPSIGHYYITPLEQLADEREVIFFDLIGCGNSDVLQDSSRYSVDYFVEQVEFVRLKLGLERFHLFGSSWGGLLGTYYLNRHPSRAASFTMANSVADFPRHHREVQALINQLPEEVRDTIHQHEASGNVSCPEYVGAIAHVWHQHACRLSPWPQALEDSFPVRNREASARLFGQGRFGMTGELTNVNATPLLQAIRCPLLFIAGAYDMCNPEHMRDMHLAAHGSEFVLFEHSSHMPFLEEPEQFFACFRDFLRRAEPLDGEGGSVRAGIRPGEQHA
jgi:proline-specific peptidase